MSSAFSIPHFFSHLRHICPTTPRLWIAYSGGLDSHVLLYVLSQLRSELTQNIQAIHIHHGLQKEADQWAMHCQAVCKALAIPYQIQYVTVDTTKGESVEAVARLARYNAIKEKIAPNDVVLTAQHSDDQAETVLLQLLRGSGVAGLAAMPSVSQLGQGWLVRPLLPYTRTALQAYAVKMNLHWIEDTSNQDTRFDRNFLRQEIMPRLKTRWSSLNPVLSRVAQHQAEANELIQILAAQDLAQCQEKETASLSLSLFSRLTVVRQRNVLRFWIKQQGLTIPSTKQLEVILKHIIQAKQDAQPLLTWKGGEIRRYHDHLFALSPLAELPTEPLTWTFPTLPVLRQGQLSITKIGEKGLKMAIGTRLEIRFRQGGEHIYWHGHHRAIKKLLQSKEIPPWQRPYIPLVFLKERLIAIPNVAVDDTFLAKVGEEGWKIEWDFNQNLAIGKA